MDFVKFLKDNKLKKGSIAEFLGVSNAFITQICSGSRKLPDEKLALILSNSNSWDTSALTTPTPSISAHASGSGRNKASVQITGGSDRIAALEKEIELLNKIIADQSSQIEFLRELLKK